MRQEDEVFSHFQNIKNEVEKAVGAKLRCSIREKNVISWFGYDYMAYHYAFILKVASVRELEIFSEATKDPRWIEAMNE